MNIIIVKDYDEVSRKAADLIIEQIKQKPSSVLGLATGSTPVGTYKTLTNALKKKEVDFSDITTFNLDEYYPIDREHDQSYWYFMHTNLFHHINIREGRKNILNGKAEDVDQECKDYEAAIKKIGGIDLQLLGIGNNGHIAFNEPGSSFTSRTRLVDLDESTIQANSRFFSSKDKVPGKALSMGLGTIMEAKKIILLATSEKKAKAVRLSIEGPQSEDVPASVLQKHTNCTFIIDQAAASLLKK